MLPSLGPTGDLLLVEHITPKLRKLKRGDVVVAFSPIEPHQRVCKRVIGLPGDTDASVLPFARLRGAYVPEGYVWLQGDNRPNSTDSRQYGPLPYCLVRGKAILRVWPPHHFGRIPDLPD